MKSLKNMRLALIQPRIIVDPDPEKNVDIAVSYIEAASSEKTNLVLFPEGVPGSNFEKTKIVL